MTGEGSNEERKFRNVVLFQHLKRLSDSLVMALEKPFSPDYGSWYDRVELLVKGGPQFVARVLETRPDLEEEKLSQCITYAEKCARFLLEEEGISKQPPHASTSDQYLTELALILARVLEEKERFVRRNVFGTPVALNSHLNYILRREYSKYESYLYDSSVSDFIVAPLYGVTCSRRVQLSDGVTIETIHEKGMQQTFHSLVQAEESHGYELRFYPDTLIRITPANANWENALTSLVSTLRLVRRENIGVTRVYRGHANPCRPWDILGSPYGTRVVGASQGSIPAVSDGDDKELSGLWSVRCRLSENGYLNLATRRFNLGYERESMEDRWVDYFISLESLFSKESELTEVTHRLSTRAARALESGSLEDRRHFREKMKDWYVVRSKIVHGTNARLTLEQLKELEDVLRRSLKWFIYHKDHVNHDKILDALDME